MLVKLFASAFFGTSLDELLRAAGCDTVVVAGASTSGCVRATAVDALQYGYRVLVPREAVADRAIDAHNASLLDIDAKYGDVDLDRRGDHGRRGGAPACLHERLVSSGNATIVTFNSARVVFGAGSSAETGEHARRLGVTRALVVCDRFVTESGLGERLEASLRAAGVEPVVYDRISGEPSETSVQEAVEAARDGFDGFIGIGGGSALDTAKLCALFATHDGELLDFVNAPIGRGRQVPGPVLPLVAVPTTSGTGSEVTTVAVVDFPRLGTKTGVSHQYLRPSVAIVDPELTLTCPPGVTASVGVDALLHALEAYTVSSYDARPARPLAERPPYQGSNPFSDPFCERAIELVGRSLRAAVSDGGDLEARTQMALASTIAGMAFSAAGVHVPHALAYPIASLKHEWQPPGYGGAALDPARVRGRGDGAGRLPLHRGCRAGTVRDGGPAARRRRRPGGVARAPARGRRRADDACASSGTARTTSPRSSRARSTSSGSSSARRRRSARQSSRRCSERRCERASGRRRVAIVGAGTMGVGISQVFASNGIPTVLVDSTPERSEAARERALELLSRLEEAGHVGAGAVATARANLSAAASVEERRGRRRSDRRGRRRAARREGRRSTRRSRRPPETAPSSRRTPPRSRSPSSRRDCGGPARFLGMHWFVPPLLVPCVEVIPAPATDEQVVQQVVGALTRLGKAAVVVGDGPGFVANRIQFAMFREAARIVEDGLATPEQVDEVVRSSFGFRLPFFGPFTIADMAGLDVYADIYETLERGLGPGFSAPALLREHVAEGDFGVKTGRGFLELSQAEADELVARRDRAYAGLARLRREVEG